MDQGMAFRRGHGFGDVDVDALPRQWDIHVGSVVACGAASPRCRRRRLSVREAARLQSFPDWYAFSGTKEQQFTQIGNAVPPLFSYKLAQSVVRALR